jgi:hypothetical protein
MDPKARFIFNGGLQKTSGVVVGNQGYSLRLVARITLLSICPRPAQVTK